MPRKAIIKSVREIVITMLGNHESIDLIHRYTAMPIEEIEQILKEQKDKGVRKDTFFKTVFQNKTMFRMFIRDFVEAQWAQAVKEENLELLPSLYPEIIEFTRENDVVYRLKMGEEKMVIIIIMLEKQSTLDFQMPFRILEYRPGYGEDTFRITRTPFFERGIDRNPACAAWSKNSNVPEKSGTQPSPSGSPKSSIGKRSDRRKPVPA